MRNNRKNRYPHFLNWNIVLPLGTLVIVGIMFYFSSAYEPNWAFNWEGIRAEIKDTVQLMENYGSVTSGVVGIAGKTPQQWHRRRWLMQNASEAELMKLVAYPDGVIKVSAYEGLIRKPDSNKYEWLKQSLNDTTTFFGYRSGCIRLPMMIGEYLLENVIPVLDKVPPPPPDKMAKYNLSEEEILSLSALYHERKVKKDAYLRKIYK